MAMIAVNSVYGTLNSEICAYMDTYHCIPSIHGKERVEVTAFTYSTLSYSRIVPLHESTMPIKS